MSDSTAANAETMLSRIQAQLEGKSPPPAIATLIGFKLTKIAPARPPSPWKQVRSTRIRWAHCMVEFCAT